MHSPKKRRLQLGPITMHSLKKRRLQLGPITSGVGTASAPGAGAPVNSYRLEVEDHNVHARQRGSCAV